MTGGIESVDEQLIAAVERREYLSDTILEALVEIDGITEHIDELLLDRRLSA